jgi:polyhydroxyalkanoate synthesis regulator phasin
MSEIDANKTIDDLITELEKEKNRADEFQGKYTDLAGEYNGIWTDNFELKQRVKELEGILASIKNDPSIGKLEI